MGGDGHRHSLLFWCIIAAQLQQYPFAPTLQYAVDMQQEESPISAADSVFGQRVHDLRAERGWSQRELTSRLAERGVTLDSSAISRMEKGQRSVRLIDALAIADVFDVHIESMLRPSERETLQERLREEYMDFRRAKDWLTEAVAMLLKECDGLTSTLSMLTEQDCEDLGHVVDMAKRDLKDAVVSAVRAGRQDYEREVFGEAETYGYETQPLDTEVREAMGSDD